MGFQKKVVVEYVPGLPVWLRQLQLLHGAESLSRLTRQGPGSK